jgi:hypothetical protein
VDKQVEAAIDQYFDTLASLYRFENLDQIDLAWLAYWITRYAADAMEMDWDVTVNVTSSLRSLGKYTYEKYGKREESVIELSDILSTVS